MIIRILILMWIAWMVARHIDKKDSMNNIKEIPLSVALELINKMVKISKVNVSIPYINPHSNIQEKLQLSISINTISKLK